MTVSVVAFVLAVALGVLPRRLWARLEPPLPMTGAAFPAALLTLAIGFFVGVNGFLTFGARAASADNAWMLRTLARPAAANPYDVAIVPYGTSVFTPIGFLLTPLGLLCAYLVSSSAIRAVSAYVGDPRGDFILSGILTVAASMWHRAGRRAATRARERREGPDVPDVLRRGAWCGVDADYLVLAARRKPDWDAGAIVMTSSDWYRLGAPFDLDTSAGLRTAYPLTRLETNEVARRAVRYELPRMVEERTKPAKP